MNFSFKEVLLICLFFVTFFSFAQIDSTQNEWFKISVEAKEKLEERNDFTIIPILFYTPETTAGFGIGGQGTFYTRGSNVRTRPSSLFFSSVYTARKQFLLIGEPKIYFNNERFLLEGKVQYKVFPDYFWGIGNATKEEDREDFNMRSTIVQVAFLRRLQPYVNFGFEYVFNAYRMLDYNSGGLVASTPYFEEQTILSGLSMVINYDSRDNYQAPKNGGFFSLKTGVSSRALGSTSSYNYASIDMRKYFSLSDRRRIVFAAQVFGNSTNGRVPFQKLSRYGGAINTRGYYLGRYTDNNMFVTQIELRLVLKGKWSMAAFGTAGDVYSELSNITVKTVKTSVGGGFRWQIRKSDPSLLRLDLAYGFDVNQIGVYFGVNEAF